MIRFSSLCRFVPVLGAALALSACVYAPGDPRARPNNAIAAARATGGATAADQRVPLPPERDRVLFDYRYAATALRAGDYEEAKLRLDDAIARIGGILTNDADAARARGSPGA